MRCGLALGLALAARPVAAQRGPTGAAFISVAEHRVEAGYGVERSSGVVLGVEGALPVGPRLSLALRAQGGSLHTSSPGAVNRDVGQVTAEARMAAAPWLTFQLGATRRVYSTVIARQRWTIVHLGAAVRVPFAVHGISGLARAALLPVVSVNGLDRPEVAFTAAAGMEYRVRSLAIQALYSLERYDFPAREAVRRLEQLGQLTLRCDLRKRTR